MTNLITSADTCAATPGLGLVTTWTLTGTTSTYRGEFETDGYMI